jgi:hypothetical protein
MTPPPTYTTPADEDFFASIGRLTLSWSQIECGLDVTILLLHHTLGGRLMEREIPWSLKRKLNYIRKWFKKQRLGKAFEILEPSVDTLLTEIERAAEFRHDLIHGFALEHLEGSGEAQMTRLLRGEKPGAPKKFTVTTIQILGEAVTAGKLGGKALKLATSLQQFINMAREMPD